MGQRSSTETIVAILKAFIDTRTWKQADLARRIGIQPAALHKRLVELQASGIPLSDEREHPHVFWSVPKSWYPGGVLLTGEQVTEVFRHLSRIPKGKARDQLLESLLRFLPAPGATAAIVPAEATAREEQYVPIIEDAATKKVALQFRYLTVTSGKEAMRHASVQRVLVGPPARFIATCHRSGDLKWFRVENVTDAKLDSREPFREADSKTVDAYLRASLDGFHDGGAPMKHEFFVSDPTARWVARNLMDGMDCEEVPGGIRVTVETSAAERLARFVVGLGGAAKPLTPELAREVSALAEGALRESGATGELPRTGRRDVARRAPARIRLRSSEASSQVLAPIHEGRWLDLPSRLSVGELNQLAHTVNGYVIAEELLGQAVFDVYDRMRRVFEESRAWDGNTVELLTAFFASVRSWRGLITDVPAPGDANHKEAQSLYEAIRVRLRNHPDEVEFVVDRDE